MVFECAQQPGGTHIIEDHVIEEVVDPDTLEPVGYGEPGERVVTSLGRGSTPLIRYRTGDLVCRVPAARCTCGRVYDIYEGGILGRVDDMKIIRGTNVYPRAIEAIVREFPVVDEFQTVITREGMRDEITLRVELKPEAESGNWEGLAEMLHNKLALAHEGLNFRIQRAAEAALATATHHNVSMVAINAPTGQVLAAVSDPISTYDTAFQGAYPPGSTFKVLTSTALIQKGLTPQSAASCPPTITVDGEVFHNAEGDQPVSTMAQAFTESCNTAFIGLAVAHLAPPDYPAVAKLYGLQRTPQLGVPKPSSQTELAGDSIGQGSVTFSPLGMATVAAAIDSGMVRAPRLVAGAPDDSIAATPLPGAVVNDLRTMMASVVSSGTAAGQGLPAGTYAKTGTAEYGTGPTSKLKIDGWLMGYRGNVTFAIVTHDTGGGDGGPVNGPIIAKFLNAIG
jgi:hypothetical protein